MLPLHPDTLQPEHEKQHEQYQIKRSFNEFYSL
jgi:hypothetical protein